MKARVTQIAAMLLIVVMTAVMAVAKSRKETVTFLQDVKVNGTLVKKGTYAVKFDEQTSELLIMKNKKVIAKAAARTEMREAPARGFELRSTGSGADAELTAVAFGGSNQNIVLTQNSASAK